MYFFTKEMQNMNDAICKKDPTTSREKQLLLLLRQKTRNKNVFKKKYSMKMKNIEMKQQVVN